MQLKFLRHLVRVAEQVAKDKPALIGKFRLRSPEATHKAFLMGTKAMLAEAIKEREAFISKGLSEAFFDDLGGMVGGLDEAADTALAGRRDHVSARVSLKTTSDEMLEVVELLNGLNRYRFKDNPEILANWDAARTVASRSHPKPESTNGSGPAQ